MFIMLASSVAVVWGEFEYTVKRSKTAILKIPKKGFQDQLSLYAGFIKLLFVIKIFALSIFEWPL